MQEETIGTVAYRKFISAEQSRKFKRRWMFSEDSQQNEKEEE